MTIKHQHNAEYMSAHSYWTTGPGRAFSTDPVSPANSGSTKYDLVIVANDDAVGDDDSAFRQKIAAGVNVNHVYSRTAFRIEAREQFHAQFKGHTGPDWYEPIEVEETCWGYPPFDVVTFTGSPDAAAVNQALSSFVSKASSVITPFQGGVFLGELTEAIHTIRHPCEGVKKLVSSYLSRVKKARPGFSKATNQRRAKYLAEQWLETSYGIRPLMSDIQSACKAAKDIVNQQSNSPEIKGFGRSRTNYIDNGSVSTSFQYGRVISLIRQFTETKAVYYGAVRMDLNNVPQFLLDKLGLGLPSFLPTIWELIPYSFLVDYFTNVGQFVQALSFPTSRLAWWGASTVVKVYTIIDTNGAVATNSATIGSSISPGHIRAVATRMNRVNVPPLIPSLSVHIPSGVGQWTNMLALAVQARPLTPY